MSNVAKIEDYLPHYTIECTDGFHVVPKSVIDDIVSGKVSISDVDPDMHIVLVRILQEWASFLE